VNNGPCNNVTEDCAADPTNGTAICTCKSGYETSVMNGSCISKFIDQSNLYSCLHGYILLIDIDECARNISNCDLQSSYCVDIIGSFLCNCKTGYLVCI